MTKAGITTTLFGTVKVQENKPTISAQTICQGEVARLAVDFPLTILNENFNTPTNDWNTENLSIGGVPENAAWTLQQDGYQYNGNTFTSNDNSQFMFSNCYAQGYNYTTDTRLISPEFSTANMRFLTLEFYHYFRYTSNSSAKIEISTDGGTNWTTLQTYSSTQGTTTKFVKVSLNLSAYANYTNVKIRFRYQAKSYYYWAIDNVKLTATSIVPTWSPITDLYTNAAATTAYTEGTTADTIYAKPSNSTTYTVTNSSATCNATALAAITVLTTPMLTIANPPASYEPVDITTNSVVIENTNGGVLSYWADAEATIPVFSPNAINISGTYYIKSTNCGFDIKPVEVTKYSFYAHETYFCSESEGITLYLSGSEAGVNYQLKKDGTATGDVIAGTGAALQWVHQTAGNYSLDVIGTSTKNIGSITISKRNTSINPESATIAEGEIISLTANVQANVLLSDDFNAPSNNWTKINASTGNFAETTPWVLIPDNYNYENAFYIHSNDNTQLCMSSGYKQYNQGTVNTNTRLISTAFSTYGYTTLKLEFWHFHYPYPNSTANVVISTDDGTTWTVLQSFTTVQGTENNFAKVELDLSAYINFSNVKIAFHLQGEPAILWMIDNVKVYQPAVLPTWSPISELFTDASATIAYSGELLGTIYAKPSSSYTYTANQSFGTCSTSKQISITVGSPTIWNGSVWSNGIPSAAKDAIINGDYTESTSFECNNLTINSLTALIINPNVSVTVNGKLTNNNGTAGIVIKSDATGTGSLIHNTASVPATVERHALQNRTHYFSSAVADAKSNSFAGGLGLYRFDAAASTPAWAVVNIDNTNVLTPGIGYALKYTTNVPDIKFVGALNTGDVSPVISHNAQGYNWNLVGNPYPSAVDWNASGWTKDRITDATYIRTGANSVATFLGGIDGIGTNGGSRYIAIGQAFWVRTTDASPVLKFTNSVRVHNTVNMLKGGNTHIFRMLVETTGYSDEIAIALTDNASNGIDALDAYKMFSNGSFPELYSLVDNKEMVINKLSASNMPSQVNLGLKSSSVGTYTLRANLSEFGSYSGAIILVDNLLSKRIDLRTSPTYAFTSAVGSVNNRFAIDFAQGVTSINEAKASKTQIFATQNLIHVRFAEATSAQVDVVDLLGRILISKKVNNKDNSLSSNGLIGVYLVRVKTEKGIISEKVFLEE